MNFWHMQLHEDNINWKREKEVLEQVGYIGMGVWTETNPSNPQQTNFEHTMKIGDIVAIRRGAKWIALTRVVGKYELLNDEQTTELGWFKRRRQVEILDWYQPEIYSVEKCGNHQPTLSICASSTADTTKNIKKWYEKVMSENQINEVSELLKYKHQVILQGPPGTGKTRLAKLVAEDLTHTEQKGKPQDILDRLIQNFDSSANDIQSSRTLYKELLTEFQNTFPTDSLKGMTLNEFAIGTGENDSFCWWLEVKLHELGRFSPGSSNNYPIYWSKDKEEYVINKKVGDDVDAESAMRIIADQLFKLVQENDLVASIALLGKSFTLKVLNSYYPDRYFPINSENSLNNALKLFGVYDKKMSLIEKNQKLYSIYHDQKEKFSKDITVNEFAGLIWSNFNLKEGENLSETDEVITRGKYKVIQFHPAYSYEDFVRGVEAKTSKDGDIHYKVENKILAQFAKQAYENPNSNYVLVIDKINRANLPSVLGELIYTLEYRGESVESMYELLDNDSEDMKSQNVGRNITLPRNLYIIGTMNTADRSVGHIDYAIRRRFAFYDVLPSKEAITFEKARTLFKRVSELFDSGSYLSSDFDANDVRIGHSYFIPSDEKMTDDEFDIELKQKLKYEIKPILYEYIKDGILLDSAREVVENLHV